MYRMRKTLGSMHFGFKLTSIRKVGTSVKSVRMDDIPHPKSLPVFGTRFNFILNGSGTRLHEYIDQQHKQLGKIFHDSLGGPTELVFTSDPVLIKSLFLNLEGKHPLHILPDAWLLYEKLYGPKRGLLFMNGEEWLSNRRVLNKHLLREKDEETFNIPIKSTVDGFIAKWKMQAEKGNFVPDLEAEFYKLSTNVIISILLGNESKFQSSKHYDELLTLFSETVKNIFKTTTKLFGLPVTLLQRFNLKPWKEFKESVDLSLFLAQKIVAEILNMKNKSNGLVRKLVDDNMSDEMVTRIVADFIIAAGDTSAYTTLWILFLLSKNNETTQEIRTNDINYVKNVVKEAMRLYPVATFLTRILPRESLLGPYKLKAETPIIASIYTSGRDEQNFSRANEFLPYRWDRSDPRKQELQYHNPSASLPFAHGARSCIGKKIAMLQLTEIVNQIVNNFDLKCMNAAEVKPVMSQVLVPDQKIKLLVSLRKDIYNYFSCEKKTVF